MTTPRAAAGRLRGAHRGRHIAGVAAALALVVAGCSDHVNIESVQLGQAEAQRALQDRGITLPSDFAFVAMTTVPPVWSGTASFEGLYTAPGTPAPLIIDDQPLSMTPTRCGNLLPGGKSAGADCVTAATGSTRLSRGGSDPLSVVTITTGDGSSRVYISISGH